MRLIPGKTKVRIELFKGVTLTDIIIGVVGLGLVALVLLSTIPGRIYFAIGVASVAILLIMRLDERSNYWLLIGFLKYLALPKRYRRMFSDDHLLTKNSESRRGEQWNKYFSEKISSGESMTQRMKEKKAEDEILESDADDEEKNAVWREREQRKLQYESESYRSEKDMEELSAFTGIGGGFIEYNGKYYGSVIEINPVEFRFFSTYRRNSSIETYFGKILRSLRDNYAANIVKIDRPIIYTKYLEREYQKLDSLRASYEQGLLTEEELKARVEIQYERIHAIRNICYDNKIVQPFYYLCLFNIDKKQLQSDTSAALTSLGQAELTVRRLTTDKELAVFLKYTNTLDFNEWEIDKIAPEDYVRWAMPETVTFTTRTAVVNKVVSHQMRVVGYPTVVGDSWLAGVMSIPSTKVVIKATPMERGKSIRAIDRSLQELRAQFNNTGIDSKRIELQTHIDTLSRLLVTLQQDNEALLTVNIYITMYDVIRTSEMGNDEVSKNSSLAPIADMKKTVRRAWSEAGMRLNGMDCSQTECYIGSQISAYDPYLNDGRGMPANTVAAMFPWIYARVSDEGGMWLGSNDGVPVFIDFFRRDSQRVNSNMVIIGKSGAGKSYGTKALLTNMASENAKIFILDPENEYSELAHNLHGKIIDVASAKYGRLNPFHIMTTLEDEDSSEDISIGYSAHLQFLEEFFRQILPDVDRDALEYLNSLVERLYMNFGITNETDLSKLRPEDYPIFDDLYDLVLEEFQRNKNDYVRSMLQTLMNYVSKFAAGGRNSVIWNGKSSITTEENFSVFNFQSLLSNRNTTIANAQMLLVLKYIDNEIIKNREYNRKCNLDRKIVVVIDEAHVFIDNKFPVALDFMFQLAKRIRKYNGMQIVITQNIKDFVGSEEIARKSTAIINACQYSFIFGLAPNDMDDLCRLYEKAGGINEMEQDRILTAPRGMAFTVMGPTSRTSFMISVKQSLVDMFQEPEYHSLYFVGEKGRGYWEDFIGDSRRIRQTNLEIHKLGEDEQDPRENKADKPKAFTFEEITEEEAAKLSQPVKQKGFTFSEVKDTSPSAPVSSVPERVSTMQPEIDPENLFDELISSTEISRQPDLQPDPQPVPVPEPEPSTYKSLFAPKEESYHEPQTSAPVSSAYEETPETPADDSDDILGSKFDIMSLLDEQLNNYNEMTLEERMDEINVNTMEVSFQELAAYVKESRKKRRA